MKTSAVILAFLAVSAYTCTDAFVSVISSKPKRVNIGAYIVQKQLSAGPAYLEKLERPPAPAIATQQQVQVQQPPRNVPAPFAAEQEPELIAALTPPRHGGIEGATNLPTQYGQVDHTSAYSGRPDFGTAISVGGGALMPSVRHGDPREGVFAGPMNGGIQGTSLMPFQYEQVDAEHPYGRHAYHVFTQKYAPGNGGQTRTPRKRNALGRLHKY